MRRVLLILIVLVSLFAAISVRADDGIPDNCEYATDEAGRALFARYEPQNQRLVLVDWRTGAEVRTLATGLAETRIVAWSPSCRYLAVAVGSLESMDTVILDALNGGEIGRVLDAHRQPHPVTWGPDDYVMVESRNGATLWHVPSGRRYLLDFGFNKAILRNFTHVRWDASAGRVYLSSATTSRGFGVYDLATGQETREPVIYQSQQGVGSGAIDSLSGYASSARCEHLTIDYYPQNRELVLVREGQDAQVLDRGLHLVYPVSFSPGCRFASAKVRQFNPEVDGYETYLFDKSLRFERDDTILIWDLATGERIAEFRNPYVNHYTPSRLGWSPDGRWAFVKASSGSYVVDLETRQARILVHSKPPADSGYSYEGIYDAPDVYWDFSRGQVLVTGWKRILTFDLRTGQQRNSFPSDYSDGEGCLPERYSCYFEIDADGNHLWIYNRGIIGRWNLDTLQGIQFSNDNETGGGLESAISPDGRYVVLGRAAIKVWDTAQFTENVWTNLPIQKWDLPARAEAIRFIDNITLEIQTASGTLYLNVETGIFAP